MICPVCQSPASGLVCLECGNNMVPLLSLSRASDQFYNEGLKYAHRGELHHARRILRKAVRYNPENIPALNLLGLVYTQTGELGEALNCWRRSVSLNGKEISNPAVDYLRRATKGSKANAMREAIHLYNQALICLNKDQLDAALRQLRKAVSLSDHFVKAKELLALCYMEKHKYEKALMLLQEIAQVDSEDPELPHLRNLYRESRTEWENSKAGKNEIKEEAAHPVTVAPEMAAAPSDGKNEAANGPREKKAALKSVDAEDLNLPGITRKKKIGSLKYAISQNGLLVQFLLFITGIGVGFLFKLLLW